MSRPVIYKYRLYIAGDGQNSVQAVANFVALCREHLPNHRYGLEVVDVLREPKRALADCIFMTPTLVKLAPLPVRRIVGTLTQTEVVLLALEIQTVPA